MLHLSRRDLYEAATHKVNLPRWSGWTTAVCWPTGMPGPRAAGTRGRGGIIWPGCAREPRVRYTLRAAGFLRRASPSFWNMPVAETHLARWWQSEKCSMIIRKAFAPDDAKPPASLMIHSLQIEVPQTRLFKTWTGASILFSAPAITKSAPENRRTSGDGLGSEPVLTRSAPGSSCCEASN